MAQKNVTRDMTQGSPLKLILTFSLPLLSLWRLVCSSSIIL